MVNSPSVNGDYSADSNSSMNNNAVNAVEHSHQHSSSASISTSTIPNAMTPLQLLQAFLKAQATRSAISNELITAFTETNITDQALHRVIEISSSGLLEVKSECEAIIELLDTRANEVIQNDNDDASSTTTREKNELRRITNECKSIEAIEKERMGEETKRLQLLRIGKLNQLAQDELDEVNQQSPDSTAACMVEQRRKMESIKTASETSLKKVQHYIERINEHLQEIREYVADATMDE